MTGRENTRKALLVNVFCCHFRHNFRSLALRFVCTG